MQKRKFKKARQFNFAVYSLRKKIHIRKGLFHMKKKKIYKILITTVISLALLALFGMTASADVATAVESTWTDAKTQIQSVVDNVVFPVLTMILAVLFFVKVGSCYFDYRKHGQFEMAAPAILFACLVFTLTAPLYIWDII